MSIRVLLVEDEPAIREALAEYLVAEGFDVRVASDAEAALIQLGTVRTCIDVLVTDIVMPGIGGVQLSDEVLKLFRSARVIYMSGYASRAYGTLLPDAKLLHKPFQCSELRDAIVASMAAQR